MKTIGHSISLIILLSIISSGCFMYRKTIDDLKISFGCRHRCEALNGYIGPTIESLSYQNKTKLKFNSQDGKYLSSIVIKFSQVSDCSVELYPNYLDTQPLELSENSRSRDFVKLNNYKISRQIYRYGDKMMDCISDYYEPFEGEESLSMTIYKYLNKPLRDFLLYLNADSSSITLYRFGGSMFIDEVRYKSPKDDITIFIRFWHEGSQSIYRKLSEPTSGLSDIENYPISYINYSRNDNVNIECFSRLELGNYSADECNLK